MNPVIWLEKRMGNQYPHYYLSPVWREVERLHLKELQALYQTLIYIRDNSTSWHNVYHWTGTEEDLRNKCSLIRLAVERTIKTKGGVLC